MSSPVPRLRVLTVPLRSPVAQHWISGWKNGPAPAIRAMYLVTWKKTSRDDFESYRYDANSIFADGADPQMLAAKLSPRRTSARKARLKAMSKSASGELIEHAVSGKMGSLTCVLSANAGSVLLFEMDLGNT